MCGITGFLSKSLNQEDLSEMTNILQHRGPDAGATYFDANQSIGLGHRRLSILDLSSSANQPFSSRCGRYVMVYNGEIYNYKSIAVKYNIDTKTTSDTEIIIESFALNGIKCIEDFNGMFSIAIWDKVEEKLWLVRDRLGIKPLYYYKAKNTFVFASELKAILNCIEIKPNLDAVATFLNLGYLPDKLTFYQDIFKLPVGTYATFSNQDGFKFKQYWSARKKAVKPKFEFSNVENAKDALKKEVEKAVSKRMISDVPLGTFLSGGIDSSLVTAVAQSFSEQPIKTFSIGFKEQKYNELIYAESVAKHLGTEHNSFILTKQEAIDKIGNLLSIYDEPYADSSAIPTLLVSELARKQVTVALSGDGGDELFLGYGMYEWAKRLNNPIVKAIRKPTGKLLQKTNNTRLQRASSLFEYDSEKTIKSHIFSQEQYYFSKKEINKLLVNGNQREILINEDFTALNGVMGIQEQQALFDLENYLPEDLLVKVDRASMNHSLEVRVPLLDHNLVEFAFRLPEKYKVNKGIRKYLLKEVLYQYVPEKLFQRPKSGFSIPLSSWLMNELRYLIEDYLSKDVVEQFGIVHYEHVANLKQQYFNGKTYLYNRIWLLILLHKWLKGL